MLNFFTLVAVKRHFPPTIVLHFVLRWMNHTEREKHTAEV